MPVQPNLTPITISGLPAATTTSPQDLIPIVQNGVTKHASLSLLPAQAANGQFYSGTPVAATIPLLSDSRYAASVVGLFGLKTTAGTLTVAIQINGVAVTGLGAVAVTAVAQDVLATALNAVAVGDRITLVISAVAGAANLEFTIGMTRG